MPQLNVRLDDDLARRLAEEAKRTGLRRSDIVRLALSRSLPAEEEEVRGARERYERVKHLLASVNTGIRDLGRNHEKYLRDMFDAENADAARHGASDQSG